MRQNVDGYRPVHQMAASTAREIRDGEVVMVGVGLPLMAGALAREDHAPHSTILFESGTVGAQSRRMPWSISDSATSDFALSCMEMWRMLGDVQAGYINVGVVGGAQIDRYGNLNSTVILGEGNYACPKVRMPGSGGANDIASSCGRTIIMMRLKNNNFVHQLDYMTSPGHLKGYDSRARAGLRGGGPEVVVTDRAIFRFQDEDKGIYLAEIDDISNLQQIKDLVNWPLKVSPNLKQMEAPSAKQLEIMARLDPFGIILGAGEGIDYDDFEKYSGAMEEIA